jgi:CBS-domain-containing membrane protein
MLRRRWKIYLLKMLGKGPSGDLPLPHSPRQSFLGTFAAVSLLAWISALFSSDIAELMLVGSFGATAAMIFGLPASPYAQPRNVLGGHLLAALCGVTALRLAESFPRPEFFPASCGSAVTCGLAVACTVYAMHKTRSFHPPGGATALIAVIGGPQVHALGYVYVFVPVGIGMLCLVLLGALLNNLFSGRRYPLSWW